MNNFTKLVLPAALFILQACHSSSLYDQNEQTQNEAVLAMYHESIETIQMEHPDLIAIIEQAPGHAVFNHGGIKALVGMGRGLGVVLDQRSGAHSYFKRNDVSLGLSVGVADYRTLWIFEDEQALDYFLETGDLSRYRANIRREQVKRQGLEVGLLTVAAVTYSASQ